MTNKELIDKVRALWVQWGGMPMFVEELDKIEEALPPEAAPSMPDLDKIERQHRAWLNGMLDGLRQRFAAHGYGPDSNVDTILWQHFKDLSAPLPQVGKE